MYVNNNIVTYFDCFGVDHIPKEMILSKCAICGSKKSRFIKNQEAKGLLSKLGIRTPLSKVQILGDISF